MFLVLFVYGLRLELIELVLLNYIKLFLNICCDFVGFCCDFIGFRNKMVVFDVGFVLEVVMSF